MVWLFAAIASAQIAPAEIVVRLVQDGHTCAGTFIADTGEVLTAYHCVVGGRRVQVFDADDTRYRGRVVRIDRSRDTAWVAVEGLELPGTTVSDGTPELGDEVVAIGHPYASGTPGGFFQGTLRYSVSAGIVSAVGPRAVQTTAPINPGNSGGPLLHADTHEVVGVVSRRVGRDGVGFAGRVREVDDGYSWLGGRLGASALGQLSMTDDGVFAAGVRGYATLRDRVVLHVDGLVPIDARWDAVRFGSSRYRRAGATLGLELPVLRGVQPVVVGVHAGVAASTRLVGSSEPVRVTRTTVAAPQFTAAVSAFGLAVEVTTLRRDEQWTALLGVGLAWPGTVSVW